MLPASELVLVNGQHSSHQLLVVRGWEGTAIVVCSRSAGAWGTFLRQHSKVQQNTTRIILLPWQQQHPLVLVHSPPPCNEEIRLVSPTKMK